MSLSKYKRSLSDLFTVVREEEVEAGNGNMDGDDDLFKTRGGGDGDGNKSKGVRSEFWHNTIANRVEENKDRSVENKRYLMRLDYRTVWIMRILTGLTVALLGTVITEVLLL